MDRGREFYGEVELFFASIGCRPRRINTKNSRAQGQAERFIGVGRTKIRKVVS
jgi:hypothetical protein